MKRPDHSDFMTHAELKKADWTGVRHNSITDDFEFWIAGSIIKHVTTQMRESNPDAMLEAHKEVFGLL